MKLSYTNFAFGGQRRTINARITTTHSSASYGMPVVLLEDGQPLDITSWMLLHYRVEEADDAEAELLQRLGWIA